jgi:hypothetical protein
MHVEKDCRCLVGWSHTSFKKLFYAGNVVEDSRLIKKMTNEKKR